MSIVDIVRAMRDPAYRATLTEEQRAALPPHPAGAVDVSDTELALVVGGLPRVTRNNTCTISTEACCSIDTTSRLNGC
ncbi:MAG TPA: mersacidin/lichenicidin family type 2 lantibiotic [Anaeromyxobacteraceae bacterium]|nr:mersacidin/lichenicidin family type 2 lantibiotic [Anaeromyxobacteraceae bacterium]